MKISFALVGFTLMAGSLSCPAVTINSLGVSVAENFDSLASSGTSSTLPADWAFSETGTNANSAYSAGTGSSNAGDTYSYGAAGSSERALGGLFSANLDPRFGVSFTNATGATIESLTIAYLGEMWRLGATGRTDRLDFQYSLDAVSLTTGIWNDVNALDFASPDTTGATGARDGNLARNRTAVSSTVSGLSIGDGATFWLRWTDFNATGSDDGLAVDDFSIMATGTATPTPETGAGMLMTGLSLLGLLLGAEVSRRRRGRLSAAA